MRRPPLGLPLLLVLICACSRGGGDPAPVADGGPPQPVPLPAGATLEQIIEHARAATDQRSAFLDAHALQVHTVRHQPPDVPASFESEIWRSGGEQRIHTRSTRAPEGMALDWEELFSGRAVRRWHLAGHNLQVTERKGTPQHIRFDRWFDHGAVAMGGLSVVGDEVVDGRDAVHLRFDVDDTLEGPAYALPGAVSRSQLDAVLGPSGLRLVEATVDYDGDGAPERIGPVQLSHWLDRAAAEDTVEQARLAPVRPRMRPVQAHAPSIPELPERSSRAFDSLDAFDVCSEIWLDRETLHPLRIDGVQRIDGARREVSLRYGDLREAAPGQAVPHQLEYRVDGTPYTTSTVTAAEPIQLPHDAFKPEAVQRMLELQAQRNNRAELEHLIARTEVKQAEPSADRDPVFHPERLMEELALQPGAVVADVGAGTGYFLPHLARAVGPTGWIIAVEVNPALIAYLDERFQDPALDPHGRVETHLNGFDRLDLPPASLDLAFLAGVGLGRFVHLDDTNREMLRSVYEALRPGGRVALVENRSQGSRIPAVSLPWLTLDDELRLADCANLGCENIPAMFGPMDAVLVTAWQSVGFEFERSIDLIEGQAFLVLRRPPEPP